MSHDQYFKHKLFFPHLTGIKQYKWISQIFFSPISLPILMKNIRFCALKLQIMYLKFYKTRKEGHYSPFFSSLGPLGPEKPMFIQCHKVCTPPFVTKNLHFSFHQKNIVPPFITKTFIPPFLAKTFVSPFVTKPFVPPFVTKIFVLPLSVSKFAVRHKVWCPSQCLLSITNITSKT